MGGHPYYYIVPYEANINAALQKLRQREFKAGRYNPVMAFIDFPITANSPAPGAQHATIEEAFEEADADGTRSILDLERVVDEPELGAVCKFDDEALEEIYGTSQPTRAMLDENLDFFEDLERGEGKYFILYRNGQPDELCFAGYSFD